MRVISPARKERLISAVWAVLLFAACFTLFSPARSNTPFTDEMHNFSLGVQVAKGAALYTDVFSQHMPLMYYISAAMSLLGVQGILGFRLAWYVLLSLAYVGIFWRYRRDFGRTAMFVWPCLYIASLTTQDLCTSILAEQLQAIGMVLLMLEFLRFVRTREVPWHMAVTIALAINISFLSAFVAAFGCAVIVAGYIGAEVWDCFRHRRGLAGSIAYLWKKYWLTIVLTLAPMALIALVYLVRGNWSDFVYQAYTINREIYSKYVGGFGSSPLSAVTGCVTQYWAFAKRVFQTLFQGAVNVSLAVILLQAGWYLFLLVLCLRRRVLTAAWLEVFFLLCGSRGFFDFHSMQSFSLCALAAALCIGMLWKTLRRGRGAVRFLAGAAAGAFLVAFAGTTGSYYWNRRSVLYPRAAEFSPVYEAHSMEGLLRTLAEPGEYVLENIHAEYLFLEADIRIPAYNTGSTPWAWEATREQSMEMLRESPPRFAIYDSDYTVFGEYVVEEFAPELDQFIQENYTRIYSDAPYFWVRNDCVEDVRAAVGVEEDMVGCVMPLITCGNLLSEDPSTGNPTEVMQVFEAQRDSVDTIGIQCGTHGRRYHGTVSVELIDFTTGDVLLRKDINGADMIDNEFCMIYDVRQDGELQLTVGNPYAVRITAEDPTGRDNLTVWACPDEATGTSYAMVNGEKQDYTLRIKVR